MKCLKSLLKTVLVILCPFLPFQLRALSHALNCGIEVVQATGPALMIGEEYVEDGGYLTITFHRHMYQLGAHYNSVTTYQEPENEDDF